MLDYFAGSSNNSLSCSLMWYTDFIGNLMPSYGYIWRWVKSELLEYSFGYISSGYHFDSKNKNNTIYNNFSNHWFIFSTVHQWNSWVCNTKNLISYLSLFLSVSVFTYYIDFIFKTIVIHYKLYYEGPINSHDFSFHWRLFQYSRQRPSPCPKVGKRIARLTPGVLVYQTLSRLMVVWWYTQQH